MIVLLFAVAIAIYAGNRMWVGQFDTGLILLILAAIFLRLAEGEADAE